MPPRDARDDTARSSAAATAGRRSLVKIFSITRTKNAWPRAFKLNARPPLARFVRNTSARKE